jgi:hypothetical protein
LNEEDVEWSPTNEGMANVRIDQIRLREADNKLLAASHGRGLYVCDYELQSGVGLPEEIVHEVRIYPNPVSDRLVAGYRLQEACNVRISILDVTGREVAVLKDQFQGAGEYNDVFNLADLPAGTYIYRIDLGKSVESGKLMKL